MPTATFPHNNPNIFKIGVGTSTTTVSGRTALNTGAAWAEMEFLFTGTGFTLPYYAQSTNAFFYYIDGVKTSPTLTLTTWTNLVVSGLPEGTHRLVLKNSGGAASFYDALNFITIEGENPSIASVNYQAPTFIGSGTPNILYTNGTFTTSNYQNLSLDNYDSSLRFRVDFTGITELWTWMRTVNAPTRWAILVDGALYAIATQTDVTGQFIWSKALSNSTLTGEHDVEIHNYTGNNTTGQSNISAIRFVSSVPPGTVPTRTAPAPYKSRVGFFGDSITQAHRPTTSANGDFAGHAYKLSTRFGWGAWNKSVGGVGIGHVRDTQIPALTAVSPNLDRLIGMIGINDISAQTTVTTPAAYGAAWSQVLTALASSSIPRVDIWKILPGFNRTATTIAPWNVELVNAVNANGNPKFRVFDVSAGFDVNLHTHDGTHLNEAGYNLVTENYLAQSSDLATGMSYTRRITGMLSGGMHSYNGGLRTM